MPAIQTTWAIRVVTQDETRARLRSIAEEDAAKAASLPKGSPGQLTGDFYAACMDESRINALGLKPLEPIFKSIDAARDTKAINAQIIQLQQIRIAAPVSLSATQDLHDTTHMIAEVGIGGLGLPDRDYYLRDEPRFKDAREKYIAYMHKMFVLAGSNDADATTAVAAVMKIETALAQARLSRVELRDPKVRGPPHDLRRAQDPRPALRLGQRVHAPSASPTQGHINVAQPKLVQAFDALLTSVPAERLARLPPLASAQRRGPLPLRSVRRSQLRLLRNRHDRRQRAAPALAALRHRHRQHARRGPRPRVRRPLSPARGQGPRPRDGRQHRQRVEALHPVPRLDVRPHQGQGPRKSQRPQYQDRLPRQVEGLRRREDRPRHLPRQRPQHPRATTFATTSTRSASPSTAAAGT